LRSTSLSISFQVSKISTCQMLGTPASLWGRRFSSSQGISAVGS
jgi:hypothetical protein